MKNSELIKEAMEEVMYDKQASIVEVLEVTDPDTAHVTLVNTPTSSFTCNVQATNGNIMVKEFGKEYDANFRVSCSILVNIKKENRILINGFIHSIVALTDNENSHIMLVKRLEEETND